MAYNFYCRYDGCEYRSSFYNRFLNHVLDKDKFERGFKCAWGLSSDLSVHGNT